MPNLTVVGTDAVAWKPSHNSGCTCKVLDMSHLDRYEIALSKVDTGSASLLKLEMSRDLAPFFFTCLLRPIAVGVWVESP